MGNKPYYTAYENRYQKVYGAGVERWGHYPDDVDLVAVLTEWVNSNHLEGKRIVEFACGEGASGEILARLGCIYQGVDIASSAVEKAKAALENYPQATVSLLDMVNERVGDVFDAALDVMGFHMLVTDSDRANYLRNAFYCLRSRAPMFFFREAYRIDAYGGKVESFDEWMNITGADYKTPEKRYAQHNGKSIEVYIPLVPARVRTKKGYITEMEENGFVVDDFRELDVNNQCAYSASIYVHKP